MRTLASIGIIVAILAGILTLSVGIALRDQRQLLDDFTAANADEVKAAAQALASRLDALAQDTRVLIDLVERSPAETASDTQRQVWESAFASLAKVVIPYRSIILSRADGSLEVTAVDPTEERTTAAALVAESARLARAIGEAPGASSSTLHRPGLRRGARSFFLYGMPVHGHGGIVVAIDVSLFLAPLGPARPASRFYATDPAGEVWTGCGGASGCRAVAPALPAVVRQASAGIGQVGARAAESLGLGRSPAVRITQLVAHPTGGWSLTSIASSEAIITREQSLLLRMLATAIAAAFAVAVVGLVLLRQERNAVALEGRLQIAQALASARETSEAIVANAPLGVLGVSQDGRVVLANEFLTERVGRVRLGAPLGEAYSVERAPWLRELEPRLLGDLPGPEVHRPHSPFEVRIVPVRNPALGVKTFALIEDRSLIRNLEDQLVRAEKLITVGVLSAGIAHEIGSPLAVIRGRAEQVLRDVATGPRADDLRVIIKHIDHISSTIRQLLDFSRRQPIVRRPVALEGVVRRARELLQWKLEPRRLRLEAELAADLPALAADPDQLQQVLVNLLLNASDASHPGGLLRLRARRAGAQVSLEVVDQGCGIALEHLHAVFDPFFTTKKGGEGTGLGLPIVASIVRNHGGEINLTSAQGQGTTVTVLWPIHAEAASA